MDNQENPLFSFGVISDVQYADINNKQNFKRTAWRYYRESLVQLNKAITKWNQSEHPISLILNLGDTIDGFNSSSNASFEALAQVEAALGKFSGKHGIHHTWGNHEFYNFTREELKKTCLFSSNCDTSYYHFSPYPKFRIVVLDGYEISTIGEEKGSQVYQQAVKILQTYNPNECFSPDGLHGLERRYSWLNGAVSKEQLDWLNKTLDTAEQDGEQVIVISHLPVFEPSSNNSLLSWNFNEILETLHKYTCVKIYMSGHDHDGGYSVDEQGLHHITVRGTVEALQHEDPSITAHVYQDRLVLHNAGPRCAPIEELVIGLRGTNTIK